MRQLIALAILLGLCGGGWMFRHQIKAMIVSHAEGDGKTDAPPEPKLLAPAPVAPGSTPNARSATTPATTTPNATTPGIAGSGPTTPIPGKTETSTSTVLAPDEPTKVEPFNVTLELLVVPDAKGETFNVEGTTNLLPGTELLLAITARTGARNRALARVYPGSPGSAKNTFKLMNHKLPEAQYQIDVVMYANRQTAFNLSGLYSQPQMLRGPLVFPKTPDGIVVRATGVLRKAAKPKGAPIPVVLKGGPPR